MTIESDIDDLAAPATNEAAISAASPESMSNEDLAGFVRDGIKQLKNLLPYVRELRQRFAALPRGHADIMGCKTWNQFCIQVLDHQPRAIRKALEDKTLRFEQFPKTLYQAVKQLLPTCEPKNPLIRFSVLKRDNLLLRVYGLRGAMVAEYELDFPTTYANSWDHKGGIFSLNPEYPKIDFALDADFLLALLKVCQGNPIITFYGPRKVVKFEQDATAFWIVAPAFIACAEEYPGEFLPHIDGAIVLMRDEDRPRSAEWLETYRKQVQAQEDARNEQRRQNNAEWEELQRKRAANREIVDRIMNRIPGQNRGFGYQANEVDEHGFLDLAFRHITIEQLERIVEVLKPAPESVQA